jgi:hypothetical protein
MAQTLVILGRNLISADGGGKGPTNCAGEMLTLPPPSIVPVWKHVLRRSSQWGEVKMGDDGYGDVQVVARWESCASLERLGSDVEEGCCCCC